MLGSALPCNALQARYTWLALLTRISAERTLNFTRTAIPPDMEPFCGGALVSRQATNNIRAVLFTALHIR